MCDGDHSFYCSRAGKSQGEQPLWGLGISMRSFTAVFCLTAALLAASSSSSRAEFRVCNSSGAEVKVAFGNNDSRYGWTSRGWWTLAVGACQGVLYGDISRGNYYVYTLDGANRAIAVPETQPGGIFCVKDGAFDLRSNGFMTPQNTIACEAHGLKSVKFRAVEVGDAVADYTYTLAPGAVGVAVAIPPIKEVAQNLPRPAPPAPPPISVAQTPVAPPPVQRPSTSSTTACQRYPNLC
jgi:uncharacterized membrane protein